jgi:hypothetical protein
MPIIKRGVLRYLLRGEPRIEVLLIKIMEKDLMPVGGHYTDYHSCNGMIETYRVRVSEDDGYFHKGCRYGFSTYTFMRILPQPPLSRPTSVHWTILERSKSGSERVINRS